MRTLWEQIKNKEKRKANANLVSTPKYYRKTKGGKKYLGTIMNVPNQLGLHARACGEILKITENYPLGVTISKNGQTEDAKSIVCLLTLAAEMGSNVLIEAEYGKAAKNLLRNLYGLFEKKFYEDK